jgi:Flp pilus assembly protein TadD
LLKKHTPADPRFPFELGEAYRAAGRWNPAVEWYGKSLAKDHAFWPASRGLGLALIAAGDSAKAVEALEAAAVSAPNEPSVLNALGDAYYQAGRLGEAVVALRKARDLHPDLAEPYNNLGVVYSAQHKTTAAQAMFLEAIRLRPDDAAAHRNLASLLAPHDTGRAIAHLQEAVRLEPENLQLHFELGALAVKIGDAEPARAHLKRAGQSSDPALREAARELLERVGK